MNLMVRRFWLRRAFCWRRLARHIVALGIIVVAGPVWGGSTTYKNYIVRTDRGWDIMCEPYIVQEGDWVYKLFRQKGEISHADFQEFLGVFGRLNPHVPNLNLLHAGQTIDIPLRKLEQGTLPGQASGMVAIPVVTLSQIDELAIRSLRPYEVQKGDTVSRLIAARFGRNGSPSYKAGLERFKVANEQVTDIDRIYAGQKILLPDPSLYRQAWSESAHAPASQERSTAPAEQQTATTAVVPGSEVRSQPSQSTTEPDAGQKRVQLVHETAARSGARTNGVLAEAAAIVDADFRNKGTYYVPRNQAPDFEIDLSRHALMEMEGGPRFVFTQDGTVMDTTPEALKAFWPDAAVIEYTPASTVEEVVAAIFTALEKDGGDTLQSQIVSPIAFEDQGLRAVVRAKWARTQNDGEKLCLTPIASPREQTPAALIGYLRRHGIVVRELLPGQTIAVVQDPAQSQVRHAIRNVLHLAPADHKDLVQKLSRALGFSYSSKIAINFFYAEMQIQAYVDMIKVADGDELLLDFGDLQGETIDAIRRSGPRVVKIERDESTADVVRTILSELGLVFEENPRFLGAARPALYNTEITINGFLYTKSTDRKILLTEAQLPQAIAELVTADGTQIIVW